MDAVSLKLDQYAEFNSIATPGGSVLLGSDYFSRIPAGELARDFNLDEHIYNRSQAGLTVAEAERVLDDWVLPLQPERIFLNFGETELKQPDFKAEVFLSAYEKLIKKIRNAGKIRIYIVSVLSQAEGTDELNAQLKTMASRLKCRFLNVKEATSHSRLELRLFYDLIPYLRRRRVTMGDAMNMVLVD
jgi:hypothetical protein